MTGVQTCALPIYEPAALGAVADARHRVVVGDEVERLVLALERDVLAQRSEVVPDVEVARRGLRAREDAHRLGRAHHVQPVRKSRLAPGDDRLEPCLEAHAHRPGLAIADRMVVDARHRPDSGGGAGEEDFVRLHQLLGAHLRFRDRKAVMFGDVQGINGEEIGRASCRERVY